MKNEEIIWYPIKPIDLKNNYYLELTTRLKSTSFLKQAKECMQKTEFKYFESIASNPYMLLINNHSLQEIENVLMNIQTLSTFPKAFNFVNIYHISDNSLTRNELNFIEQMSPFINPNILNNPRSMQQFMLKALKVYRTNFESEIFKTIKPLKATQTWLSTELDKIGIDIFTS